MKSYNDIILIEILYKSKDNYEELTQMQLVHQLVDPLSCYWETQLMYTEAT